MGQFNPVNNINDDGTIPRYETNSWQTHNTYRLNALPTRGQALAAPDLVAAYVRTSESAAITTVTARVGNGGAALAPSGVKVAFYAGDPKISRTLLGVGTTTGRMVPGAFEDVSVNLKNPPGGELWVVADDDGTGKGQVSECQEGNNFYRPGLALPFVNHPPVITSSAVLAAIEGQAYSYDVEAQDSDAGDTLSFSLALAPQGMAIEAASGLIKWTPAADDSGWHPIQLTVADNSGAQAHQMFLLQVTDKLNAPPVFVSLPPKQAVASTTVQYDALARDADADALSYDLLSAPAGMVVETNTGVVAWRPLLAQVGMHDVILRASDGKGGVALQSFQLTVSAPNTPPVFVSFPPTPAVAGLPYQYLVRVQDAEEQALAFALGSGAPAGMGISSPLSAALPAVLAWTPALADIGFHHFEIIVSDVAGAEGRQVIDLEVAASAPNHAPQFVSQPRTQTRVGMAYAYFARASDADGDPVSFQLVSGPAGMILTAAEPSSPDSRLLTWTPSALGSSPVVLKVTDGRPAGVSTQEFLLTVTSTLNNSAPTIVSNPRENATVGQAYRYDLVAQDPDDDPVTWRLVSGPVGMSLDAVSGSVRWTSVADQFGTNTVTVEVRDTLLATDTQTFTIDVNLVNRSPQISSIPLTAAEPDSPYLYALRATDPDEDTLTFAFANANEIPGGMTLSNLTAGPGTGGALIRWTPAKTQVGAHSIRVTVSDNHGGTDTQGYNLYVVDQRSNHAPVIASAPPRGAGAGRLYTYTFLATDPDGDAITLQAPKLPAGATFSPGASSPGRAEAVVTWTPTDTQSGLHDIILVAKDPSAASASQRFTVSVRVNQPPLITSDPPIVAVPGIAYGYDVGVYDPDGDVLAYALTQSPSGMSIDSLGRITWTPTFAQIGARVATVRATDPYGASVEQTFNVVVSADTEAPRVALEMVQGMINPADGGWAGDLGSTVTFRVSVSDNVGVASRSLVVGAQEIPLNSSGAGSLLVSEGGTF